VVSSLNVKLLLELQFALLSQFIIAKRKQAFAYNDNDLKLDILQSW